MNLINSYQCSSLTWTPQYESKFAKKFEIWLSKNDNIQIYKNARMLQDLNPNACACTCCMFVSGYFHLLGMRKTRRYIACSKVGLDLSKRIILKNTSKILEHKTGIDLTVSSTLKMPSKNYACFISRRFGLFLIHLQSKNKATLANVSNSKP